jgi:hypothetical protein
MPTANEYLFNEVKFLQQVYKDITRNYVRQDGNCILSTYAYASGKCKSGPKQSTTLYPVIKRKCPDGKSRRFYCHHVVAMYTEVYYNDREEMWDTSKMHVSHDCHNTRCVKRSHISVITKEENLSKNINCIGKAKCSKCRVVLQLCKHATKCLTTVEAVCSNCV